MSFTILDCDQRSPEWTSARLGRLCGSKASDMLTEGRGSKEAAGRRNLRVQLALERITGRSHERKVMTAAMQDGVDREPDAAALYEALTGRILSRSGFLRHDVHMAGCSLDGDVNDFEGIVEIKSPLAATHLEYLTTGRVPTDYLKQIIHGLWISGAQWCDWLSYQPEFPEGLQTKLVRVERDDQAIRAYEGLALVFLEEVDRAVEQIEAMRQKARAAA